MKKILTVMLLLTVITVYNSSCKKFLDLKPIDSPTESTFYVDEKGLQGGLVSAYDALQSTAMYGQNFIALMEIRGDNAMDNDQGASGGVRYQIESFSERPDNTIVTDSWLGCFRAIFRSNMVISRASDIVMDETRKKQIVAQAKFLRALNYFNTTRLWGKLPLITSPQTTEEARNNRRADESAVYAQIENDLKTAITDLPETWPANKKGSATTLAAQALLAKVYLYQKKYNDVVALLGPLVGKIKNGATVSLVPQPQTFPNGLKTSKDILFSVQFLLGGVGESVLQNNRYRNSGDNNAITLPQSLFESNDNRKALVAPTGNGQRPGKFDGPAVNEETSMDMPVLRCAEVMLIYAEALNEVGYPDNDALNALNAVRLNAGIAALNFTDLASKAAFTTEVYKQRRLELALELDRWFDIVRTGQMPVIYPLVDAYRKVYPIPQTEIQNISDQSGWQNEGYQ
ncbi:MAG: RagB/SusD family nutrient uptake outer membrane protein [Bacteroidetes bacterium]|nr:RagB/SusD family nutrient uptake outer membrane protein [Bacteroidota bacterium]